MRGTGQQIEPRGQLLLQALLTFEIGLLMALGQADITLGGFTLQYAAQQLEQLLRQVCIRTDIQPQPGGCPQQFVADGPRFIMQKT